MSILDSYRETLGLRGHTLRDRNVNVLQRTILKHAPGNPACKNLFVNGEPMQVVINSKDDFAIKELVCLPGDRIPFGSDIIYRDMPWLVITIDIDDDVYAKSRMHLCNCVLRWKDRNGVLHEYNGVAEDATKYSEGIESTQYLRIAEFQIKVKIHLDSVTAIIDRDMRFIIDADKYIDNIVSNNDRPFVFKVTRRNIVTGSLNGEGYVEITLVQDQWIEGRDDYIEMVASQPYELDDVYPIINPSEDASDDAQEGRWL